MKILLYFFALCIVIFQANCHDNTFPIEEESLLDILQKKLKAIPEETLQEKQKEWQEALVKSARTPKAVPNIGEASSYRSKTLDPSITLNDDITGMSGEPIAKKGTRINPLEHMPLSFGILLFDGTKPTHVAWAKEQVGRFRWVLVKGSPLEVEEQEERAVFFDQNGWICRRFCVENVPCRISQNGDRVFVEEIPITGQ